MKCCKILDNYRELIPNMRNGENIKLSTEQMAELNELNDRLARALENIIASQRLYSKKMAVEHEQEFRKLQEQLSEIRVANEEQYTCELLDLDANCESERDNIEQQQAEKMRQLDDVDSRNLPSDKFSIDSLSLHDHRSTVDLDFVYQSAVCVPDCVGHVHPQQRVPDTDNVHHREW